MYEKFLNYFTDYIFVKDEPQKADVIFVPGNGYPQMAVHAAKLWKEGFAPVVLPSGRYSTVIGHFAGVQDLAEQYGGAYEPSGSFCGRCYEKRVCLTMRFCAKIRRPIRMKMHCGHAK